MTEKIIDRVRKMLALANDAGASQGERDNALRMVSNLLAKHNLDMVDVNNAGQRDQEPREQQSTRMSVYPWVRNIAHTVAGLFFCEYYFQRPRSGKTAEHFFVGKQRNAITANEMAVYVVSSVFKELRARFGSETSPEARAFATGVDATLRTRVREIKAAQSESMGRGGKTDLVLASLYDREKQANAAWLAEHVGGLKVQPDRTKDVQRDAYYAGKEHGKSISLANQLGTAGRSNVLKIK